MRFFRPTRRVITALAVVLLAAAACRPYRPPVPVPEPRAVSPEAWIQAFERRTRGLDRYQAIYRVRLQPEAERTVSLQVVVSGQLPERFRIEARNTFGQTAGVVAVGPRGSGVWLSSENTLYLARDGTTILKGLLGISMDPALLGHLLAGCLPLEDLKRARFRETVPNRGRLEVKDRDGAVRIAWDVGLNPPLIYGASVPEPPQALVAHFDPAVSPDPEQVPENLRIMSSRWVLEAKRVQFQKVESFPPGHFAPPSPKGARRVLLDERP
ncbi:hypothetical protein [Desulfoglaeba alkanexedens]|uniref:DUF4292 domain-containing protein n=1 Tax=Desulfoglaeba alkanexedens ALDC TaxID=980445 RepID=A0A4P8L1U3_9BACT|nr:hypothetical protein [Desulfoglaeba alkanexedens]QCQ20875.1 hypothetical protein FDQ92_00870 [Desulfoglaeba alkanexedens ALDC]